MSRIPIILILFVLTGLKGALAQDFERVEVRVEHVRDGIYVLYGEGGNIGVSVGDDATFIVDDQFAPLTGRIVDAIETISDHPVDFVINTHWHFDHTGGNENFGELGALIVSHENSRERMTADQFIELVDHQQEAYTDAGLPTVTFDESVRFHLNGETIDIFYLGPAHTDGDAMVHFRDSNIMHTGDVFVRYGLPVIDQPNGGSINGMVDVLGQLIEMTDAETVFIPGHGALGGRTDLIEFHSMLRTIRDRVDVLVREGRSLAEILETDPTAGFPEAGIPSSDFIRVVYNSLIEESE